MTDILKAAEIIAAAIDRLTEALKPKPEGITLTDNDLRQIARLAGITFDELQTRMSAATKARRQTLLGEIAAKYRDE